jgi:hypothetical protein
MIHIYRFVIHERVRDYLDLGWMFAFDLGRPHSDYSVALEWRCNCPMVEARR